MKEIIITGLKLQWAGIKRQPQWVGKVIKNAVKATSCKDFIRRHKELTLETIDLMSPETKAFYTALNNKYNISINTEEVLEQTKEYIRKTM
jgi:hypothetical protein